MARLYLHLIEADDNHVTLGTPVAMVCEGTAEQVIKICAAITKAMKMLGFENGGMA